MRQLLLSWFLLAAGGNNLAGHTSSPVFERGRQLLEQQLDVVGAANLLAQSIANREPESPRALCP